MGLDACNGDPVGRVAHKDLAHHVQALPGDVQVCGEAVLHPHDPLQPRIVHVHFLGMIHVFGTMKQDGFVHSFA